MGNSPAAPLSWAPQPSTDSSRGTAPVRQSPVPPPRSRRWLVPTVAIVVAAILIVSILATAAYLSPKSTASPPTLYTTLDEAEALAAPAMAHALAGSWVPALAVGIRVSSNLSLPTGLLPTQIVRSVGGCNLTTHLTPLSTLPNSFSLDLTPTSAPSGSAGFWLLGMSNGDGVVALVSVNLGLATPLYTVVVQTCLDTTVLVAPFASSAPDSPALVAAANASGGATFLDTYPYSAQIWAGLGGFSADGITFNAGFDWEVVDTSCPLPNLINETGSEFNATLTAAGSVVVSTTGSVNCELGLGGQLPTLVVGGSPTPGSLAQAI
jgi:hypothetical protein